MVLALLYLLVNITDQWYIQKQAFNKGKYFTYFQKYLKGFLHVLPINISEPILCNPENRKLGIELL